MFRNHLLWSLITLILGKSLPSLVVSSYPQSQWTTRTLAIDIGSSATRLSFLEGDNGFVFGDTGPPRIIYTGPGVHSSPEPRLSNWTEEGFLLVKRGTDISHYIHPYNTVFNIKLASLRYEDNDRPSTSEYHAFTPAEITREYLRNLIKSAESTLGYGIENIAIVLPDGQNLRTIPKEVINHKIKGNYTRYDTVSADENDSRSVLLHLRDDYLPSIARPFYIQRYRRSDVAIFPFNHGMHYNRGFLVYHLSNSTFEVSVHRVYGSSSEILSSVHHPHLGGNDFNNLIIDYLLRSYNQSGQNLTGNEIYLRRMKHEVENAKRLLSTQEWVQIDVRHPESGGHDLSEKLTRSKFEDLSMDLVRKTLALIDQVIKDSAVFTKDDIQDVVFSGGSTNIPFIQSSIKQYFGADKTYHGLMNPESNVVLSAAKFHHWYQDERHNNGPACCVGGRPAILGIETTGGAIFLFSDPDSDWDLNKVFTFTTTKDNQDRIVIRLFAYISSTKPRVFLDEFELTGIAPAPKGVPQIRVRISLYSCDFYANVNVMDMKSGRINGTIYPDMDKEGNLRQRKGHMVGQGDYEIALAGGMIPIQ